VKRKYHMRELHVSERLIIKSILKEAVCGSNFNLSGSVAQDGVQWPVIVNTVIHGCTNPSSQVVHGLNFVR